MNQAVIKECTYDAYNVFLNETERDAFNMLEITRLMVEAAITKYEELKNAE